MAQKPPNERPKETHSFQDFKGVNTQAARQNIGDNEFAWLENVFPLGFGNLRALPGPSLALGSWPTGTATFFQSFNLNFTPILIVFTSTGGGYNINLETNVVTQFASDGTFSGTTAATSWSDTDILIIDNENGYFTYDGTTLTRVTGTIQSITIVTPGSGYTSRPTITIAAPGSGTTATATTDLQVVEATNVAQGTGYAVNDVLTVVGGTFNIPAQFTVSAIGSGGTVTGFNISDTGDYTVIPTGTVSVTGGFGSGATFTLNFGIGPVTLTNPGSGYTSDPTVTLSGGGGSGASLTANLSVAPSSGNAIAVYSGRVWISNGNRTIIFSAPGSFTDFSSANAGGSFVMTDSTLINIITAIYSANGYLYILGKTSINVVSGVQVSNGVTVFSNTNITASIGTNQMTSLVPYYRGLAFATQYGFYILNGTTCQKLSDNLDGYFTSIDLTKSISGGYVTLFENICLAFLTKTTGNSYANYERSLVAIFFNKKWTFSSQGDNLTLMCTALYNGVPMLFATDGTNFYSLFTNNTGIDSGYNFSFLHKIVSRLWPMETSINQKQTLKFAIETNIAGASSTQPVVGIVDSEVPTNFTQWSFNVTPIGPDGYYFGGQDVQTWGKYIGFQLTDQYPQIVYSAFHIQYEITAPWITLPPYNSSNPPVPVWPTLPSPQEILTAAPGVGETFENWIPAPGATSYNLYWSLTPGAGTSGNLISDIKATNYTHTGLTGGTTYYYVVTAVNYYGESLESNQAQATPFTFPTLYAAVQGPSGSNFIYQFSRQTNGQLTPLSTPFVGVGSSANPIQSIFVSPNGLGVYATDNGGNLFQFSRNYTTGLITPLSPSSITMPSATSAHSGGGFGPSGNMLYLGASSVILGYPANPDQTLGTPISGAADGQVCSIHPSGSYVYSSGISRIDQLTSSLTNLSPPFFSRLAFPHYVAISPNGVAIYESSNSEEFIYQSAIQPDGQIEALTPSTVTTGSNAEGIAVSPDGLHVYNVGTNLSSQPGIYMYSVSGGLLSPLSPGFVQIVQSGCAPQMLVITADGKFVYVADVGLGLIYQYARNSATGQLTALSPFAVSTTELSGTPDGVLNGLASFQ